MMRKNSLVWNWVVQTFFRSSVMVQTPAHKDAPAVPLQVAGERGRCARIGYSRRQGKRRCGAKVRLFWCLFGGWGGEFSICRAGAPALPGTLKSRRHGTEPTLNEKIGPRRFLSLPLRAGDL